MTDAEIKRILEALLFVSEKSLLLAQAREVLGPDVAPEKIKTLFAELTQEFEAQQRGLRIVEVAEGWQMVTDPALAQHVARLTRRVRAIRLTKPSLETMAIIAYRQPLTKIEIEQIRGVDTGGVLDTLLRLNLIKITGRKEAPGRPLLYGTTREFLDHFGLRSLEDLPSKDELQGVPSELKDLAGLSATESGAEIAQTAETETVDEAVRPEPVEGRTEDGKSA